MAKQTLINTADDMRWLRDVHLPRLPSKYKSALIVGNEDYPDRIEIYERRDPRVQDVPVIFEADEEGVFKRRGGAHHATKKPEGFETDAERVARVNGWTVAYAAGWLDGQTQARHGQRRDPSLQTATDDYARGYSRGYSDHEKRSPDHATKKKSPAQLQREIDEALRTSDREAHGYDTERLSDREFEQAARFEGKKYGLSHEEALRFVKHPRFLSIRKDVEDWRGRHGFPATNSALTRGYLLDKLKDETARLWGYRR